MAAPRRSTRSRQVEAEEPAIATPAAAPTHSPPRKWKRSFQAETAPLKSEALDTAGEGIPSQSATETAETAAAVPAASPTPPARKNAKVVKLKRPARGTAATAAAATSVDGRASQAAEGEGDEEPEEEGEPSGSRASPSTTRIKDSASTNATLASGSQPPKTSEDYILPREQELWLPPADAEKLRTVAKHLMPELLEAPLPPESNFAKQSSGVKGKAKEKIIPSSTLLQALDGRRVSLRQLRAFALALREPLLAPALEENNVSAGAGSDEATTAKKLSGLSLFLGFIDEIAARARAQDKALANSVAGDLAKQSQSAKKTGLKGEGDVLDDDLEALLQGDFSNAGAAADKRYALHMRLATGDYFTKAVELTSQQAAELKTGLADLVAIESLPEGSTPSGSIKPPTLGERVHRDVSLRVPTDTIEELREKRLPKLKGVQYLYYGPHASFAPTYDSSASSLSRSASNLLWRKKLDPKVRAAKAAWHGYTGDEEGAPEGDEDESEEVNIPPPPPAPIPSKPQPSLEQLDSSLDAEVIRNGLEQLDRDTALQEQLESNAVLLAKLQDCQWDRLRKGYARSKALEAGAAMGSKASLGQLPEDEPSDEEKQLAGDLYKGLGELIALRPRSTMPLLPTQEQLRALAHSAAIDPIFTSSASSAKTSAGYWGTLDPSLYSPDAPVRLAGKVSTIVPTFTSSETVRLDDSGESLAYSNAMSKRGVPLGVARDSGKGMLDRLATISDVHRGFLPDSYGGPGFGAGPASGPGVGGPPTMGMPMGAPMAMSPPPAQHPQQLPHARQSIPMAQSQQGRYPPGSGSGAGSPPLLAHPHQGPASSPPNGHAYPQRGQGYFPPQHAAGSPVGAGTGAGGASSPPHHGHGAAGGGYSVMGVPPGQTMNGSRGR